MQQPIPPSPVETVEGTIERITFHADDTGYTVARLQVRGYREPVTIVGAMGTPAPGETVRVHGRWAAHPKFGRQLLVERYETLRPATAAAIEKYLGSGLIKGVGPVTAKRLVRTFGGETLNVIEEQPGRLTEVPGIGPGRADRICAAWKEQQAIREVMLFLQGHGVSATFAVRIYRAYRDDAIRLVEENPYRLAADIRGIGFKSADRIARALGFAADCPPRLRAGILHTLSEATNFGHLFLPADALLKHAAEILEVDEKSVRPILAEMVTAEEVVSEPAELPGDPPAIYHPALFHTEIGLASRIRDLSQAAPAKAAAENRVDAWLDYQARAGGLELSPEQRQAVTLALNNRLLVLTGGPGTGKTTVTNLICRAFDARHCRILLASPTGRAAKRLAEVTGREAQTVHRLLQLDPASGKFRHNSENPLECDVLIADEVSMLDAVLANSLLQAVPDHAQVVLVGDADQLPSVGAGNVLRDMIASGTVPVCRLTQIFRQAAESLIVTNAHRINQGEWPKLLGPRGHDKADCVFIEVDNAEAAAEMAVRVATISLPRMGFGRDEIQILAPMHRGSAGVGRMNERMQNAWNPPRPQVPELARGGQILRQGDRVIQLINDYDRDVFNGDIGTIRSIDTEAQDLVGAFSDAEVTYDFHDCDELQLAYALSIHKSQGSEYPAVVLLLCMAHFMMLQRNLLYTALTRARRMCVLVGEKRAIGRAVSNASAGHRYTHLAERLRPSN